MSHLPEVMTLANIRIPQKLIPLFLPSAADKSVIAAYGGRGSGKTRTFAKMAAIRAYQFASAGIQGTVLCAREHMRSLRESSFAEISAAIKGEPFLRDFFVIGEEFIRAKNGMVDFTFTGLRYNLPSVKSRAKVLLCWIDEAETISEKAYLTLIPTLREQGTWPDGTPWRVQLWVTWNPETRNSATDKRFRQNLSDDILTVEINYKDNEFFPEVLERARLQDKKTLDPAIYRWVWEGAYLEYTSAQVFNGKFRVRGFASTLKYTADAILFGADFGFSSDPSTLISGFELKNEDDTYSLYIDREAYATGVEIRDYWSFYSGMEGATPSQKRRKGVQYLGIVGSRKWKIKADGSRPETISHIRSEGFDISAAKKWPGSVEDGISYMRSYKEIIIHPSCKHTIFEFNNYCYKIAPNGDILPVVVDANNHCIDAIRYMLDGKVKKRGKGIYD